MHDPKPSESLENYWHFEILQRKGLAPRKQSLKKSRGGPRLLTVLHLCSSSFVMKPLVLLSAWVTESTDQNLHTDRQWSQLTWFFPDGPGHRVSVWAATKDQLTFLGAWRSGMAFGAHLAWCWGLVGNWGDGTTHTAPTRPASHLGPANDGGPQRHTASPAHNAINLTLIWHSSFTAESADPRGKRGKDFWLKAANNFSKEVMTSNKDICKIC